MRIVLLLLALAGLATGVLFYLGDDDAVRSVPRSRRGGEAADLERRGFLLFEIRLEHPGGAPAAGATVVYEGPASGRAVADAAGVVQVGGLTEGFYTVRARAEAQKLPSPLSGASNELRSLAPDVGRDGSSAPPPARRGASLMGRRTTSSSCRSTRAATSAGRV